MKVKFDDIGALENPDSSTLINFHELLKNAIGGLFVPNEGCVQAKNFIQQIFHF